MSADFVVHAPNGQQIPLKSTWQYTPDHSGFSATWMHSTDDGATWTAFLTYRAKKSQQAAE